MPDPATAPVASPQPQAGSQPQGGQPQGGQPQQGQAGLDRPAWLPAKFNSVEDLAKGYTALEQQFHARTSAEGGNNDLTITSPDNQGKGLNLDGLAQEFVQGQGRLSEATLRSLEAKGISRADAMSLAESRVSAAVAVADSVFNEVGGRDAYTQLTQWASANLSPAEQQAFNSAVKAGRAQAMLAVRGLKMSYESANGKLPNLEQGGRPGTGGGGFRSMQEQMAAQKDPRYGSDPAYTDDVMKKIEASAY